MAASVVVCPNCATKNRLPVSATGRPRCASCHQDLPWLVDAGDDSFGGAVATDRLVLVDLWAPWCGPCRMVAPILERLSSDYAGRLKVVKVNVDSCPRIAQQFRATSIPMLVFMRDGAPVETVVGAQPEHALRNKVTAHLST